MATIEGDAAGEAAGLVAADGLALVAAAGLAEGLWATAGPPAAEAADDGLPAGEAADAGLDGADVAAGALVGLGAAAEQPSASKSVALVPSPPVMFNTRRTRSRRDKRPVFVVGHVLADHVALQLVHRR